MKHLFFIVVALAVPIVCPAVTIGQMDTFESGGTEGWTVALGPGGGAPDPSWAPSIASGGAGGVDDEYLLLRSLGGGGAGSRLTAMNVSSWTGDYLTSGVNAIQMNVRNFGSTDLSLRLAFETLGAMGPTDVVVSTVGVPVSAGGDWTTVLFKIDGSSLTVLAGSASNALANVNVVRIFHNPTDEFPPQAIAGSLGVDDISAMAIPEPSTMLLAGVALGGMLLRLRR